MTVPTQQNPNQPDASRHFPATRSRVRQVGARENQVARKRHKYLFLLIVIYYYYISVAEPGHFGRSRCEGPAPP